MMQAEIMSGARLMVDMIDIANEVYTIDLKKEWRKKGE
jgi:hypothetical protein